MLAAYPAGVIVATPLDVGATTLYWPGKSAEWRLQPAALRHFAETPVSFRRQAMAVAAAFVMTSVAAWAASPIVEMLPRDAPKAGGRPAPKVATAAELAAVPA